MQSINYHVCILDVDHTYSNGYCLGGFWGSDQYYGLFSTEIAPLAVFKEIGSRHYHCDLNFILGGEVHTVIVDQAEDGSPSDTDNVLPSSGIFYTEVYSDQSHLFICSRTIISFTQTIITFRISI